MGLRDDLRDAINRNSAENASDTPDWLLAGFLMECLDAFDRTLQQREKYYGRGMLRDCPTSAPLDHQQKEIKP